MATPIIHDDGPLTSARKRELRLKIAELVRKRPDLFAEAGRALTQKYSPANCSQKHLRSHSDWESDEPTIESWTPSLRRLREIVKDLLLIPLANPEALPTAKESRTIVLVHWLLTDAGCNSGPKLTSLQDFAFGSSTHEQAHTSSDRVLSMAADPWIALVEDAWTLVSVEAAVGESESEANLLLQAIKGSELRTSAVLTTETFGDLDIQVRAHVLSCPALYEQAGKDIDATYSPEAFWQDDLALCKSQADYLPENYPTLDQWRPAAKRAPLIVWRLLENHRRDRGIPPANEAARAVLMHWVLTDQACNSAPVKLTAFQDWSNAGIDHDLGRVSAFDIADNSEWREYVRKALAVMQSQSAMAATKPVPILGVIWHDASAPVPALKDAFDRYWQTLDAATVPAGDDRRIPEDAGAVLLSEATAGLHNALAAEHSRLLMEHGREVEPPDDIQLWESDYPDGRDATLIPKSAVKVRMLDIGRGGADARLMTAIERARTATACPVERHNAQNAVKPGGPHRRYFAGDVIRRETIDALESVDKLLRLNSGSEADVMANASRKLRIGRDEANVKARNYLKQNPTATARDVAENIGCSLGLVGKLTAWKAVQEARTKQKSCEGSRPNVVSFTAKLENTVGADDAELNRLIEEQSEDARSDRRVRQRRL